MIVSFCKILNKHEFSRQILVKASARKQSNESRFVPCREMDRQIWWS